MVYKRNLREPGAIEIEKIIHAAVFGKEAANKKEPK